MSPTVFQDDNVAIAYGMGITAEKVAEEWKVSREDQDAFALGSHQKALAAIAAGEFQGEISPYSVMARIPAWAARKSSCARSRAVSIVPGSTSPSAARKV
jgi:acetyl-CoA acyltransferase